LTQYLFAVITCYCIFSDLIQAKDLVKADLIGKSDPFAVISFDDQCLQTPTVKNSLNPEWNFKSDIPVSSSGPKEIKIAVFDDDKHGKNKPLGSATVNVGDVINGNTLDKDWIPLKGAKSGKVQVSAKFSELDQISPDIKRHGDLPKGAKGTSEVLTKQNIDPNKRFDYDDDGDYATSPQPYKKLEGNDDIVPAGQINLEILEAKDLMKADIIGKSDPYAVVSIGDNPVAKTPVIKNNQNPKWNFSTCIPLDEGSPRIMNVEIFDSDKHGKDRSLGSANIDLMELVDDNPLVDTWLPLKGVKTGKVRLSADFTPEEEDFDTIKRKVGQGEPKKSKTGGIGYSNPSSRKQSEDALGRKGSGIGAGSSTQSAVPSSSLGIPCPGNVHVNIIQAKDLIKSDMIGKCDPYAVLSHGNDKVKSNIVKNSQNPLWNFEVDIPVDENSDPNVKIDLFNSDRFGKDKPLGNVNIDISELAKREPLKEAWIPLSGVKSGHLQVSAEYVPTEENIHGMDSQAGSKDPRKESVHERSGRLSGARNLKGLLGVPRKESGLDDNGLSKNNNDLNVPEREGDGDQDRLSGSRSRSKDKELDNDIPEGNLHLNIIQAKDLIKKDIIGKSDPYAVITYGNDKIKSKAVKNTQNPEWNFEADIPIDPSGPRVVKVDIFDDDKYGKDKPLGSLDIDIAEIAHNGPHEKSWIPLSGVKSGLVQISADFQDGDEYHIRRPSKAGDNGPAGNQDNNNDKPSKKSTPDHGIGKRKYSGIDDIPHGNLHLEIIQGKDLVKLDTFGKSDPFAVVTYGNEKIKTKTVKNSQNPDWNFEADIPLNPNGPKSITVDVFDDDKFGKDNPIGSTEIDIASIVNKGPVDKAWLPLDGVKSGKIQISAEYEPADLENIDTKAPSKQGGALGLKNRLKSPDRKISSRSRTPSDDTVGSRKPSDIRDGGNKLLPSKTSPDEEILPGNLHLNIMRGKELVKSDLLGKSDPYVVVSYGNEKVKTKTVKNNQNPEFNFETDLIIPANGPEIMKIEVFDKDKFGKDKSLGSTNIEIASIQHSQSLSDIWIPLDNVRSGQLQISADFQPDERIRKDSSIQPKLRNDKPSRNGGGAPTLKDQLSRQPGNNDGYEYDHGSLGDPRYSKNKGDINDDKLGTIKLDLLCAKNLTDADLVGKSDPYAIISYGAQTYKTEIKNNTLNPEWNIQCDIQVPEGDERNINIALYDADGSGKDDFLGEYNMDIAKIMNLGGLKKGWHPLSGTKSGEVCISADFVPDLKSSAGKISETTIIHQRFQDRLSSVQFLEVNLNKIPLPSAGGNIEAFIRRPSGQVDVPLLEDNNNGTVAVKYQPSEEGLHYLDVKYNGEQVQGSPFKFHVNQQNAGQALAYGPGLTHGVCGEPANFSISTKGAGAGGLSLAVEGPSKAEINCHDNKDGTVSVSYMPTAPGEYKITAKFADKHIPGSPFTCKITGEGKKRNQISVGSSSELQLPGDLSEADIRSLKAYIQNPSGGVEQCFLKRLPKGNIGISFTPREVGEHLVSVQKNGKHIANSPFKIFVNAQEVGDSSRVRVGGDGLERGQTHVYNRFQINTKSAGYGGLSLSIEGPSKAEIECKDNEDGTLDVDYKPTEPGFYIINIKFADSHVPGSPFQVPISGTVFLIKRVLGNT
jgi:Ca2+-dependent lipid-binding protein